MKTIKTVLAVLAVFVIALSSAAYGTTNSNGTSGTQVSEGQNASEGDLTAAKEESEPAYSGAASEEISDTAAAGGEAESSFAEDPSARSDILVA